MPDVEAWIQQYLRGVWPRKKFLVLDGPSIIGKTGYVRSAFGAGTSLERNAACSDHVSLS